MKSLWNASSEEFMENPEKFGAPTFEQFKKNPFKYVERHDSKFANIERGPTATRKLLKKMKFEIEGHRCDSLEKVERVAADYGIPLHQLDYTAEILPLGGGNCDILVKFITKKDRRTRATW